MTPTNPRQPRPMSSLSGPTSRREFLVLGGGTAAAVSLFGLSACGGDSGGTAGSGEVLMNLSPDVEEIVLGQIEAFNKANPDGRVTTRITAAETGQAFEQFQNQFRAGNAEIDVIMGDIIWPPPFASNGWISDLSDQFTDEDQSKFLPEAIAGNTYEDAIYGVPWFTDAGFLYYRTDLLEDAGFSEPPQTWDELKEMASKVQQDANIENGFVFTGAQYEGGTQLGIEFIRTAGGDVFDDDNETVIIDSPEAIAGLAMQQSLVAEGIAPQAVANFEEDLAGGAFMRGDSVFMRMWPYQYDFLGDPEESSLAVDQVELTKVPVLTEDLPRVNVGGGFNFFINADAGDQEASYKLIEYLTAPEQQKKLAIEGAYLPTLEELYDDQEVIDAVPAVRLGGLELVGETTPPPVSPFYSDMSLAMAEAFNGNILGETTPEETAANLKEELESIISRGG